MIPFEDLLFFDSQVHGISADAMTICRFSGRLDRECLERAIRETANRSRIGRRCAVCEPNGTLEWSKEEFPVVIRYFHGEPTPETFPDSAISITQEAGIRFWIYDQPEENRFQLWFQFHHLTTDALGSFLFLDEVFERCAGMTVSHAEMPDGSEIREALRPEFCGELRKTVWKQFLAALRDLFFRRWNASARPLELREAAADGKTQIPCLIGSGKMLSQTPKTGVQSKTGVQGEAELPILFHSLTRQETQELRECARSEGVSVNELLLAAVFRAVWRLKEAIPNLETRGAVQIAIPVSLRQPQHDFPLRNLVSVVFLTEKLRTWQCRFAPVSDPVSDLVSDSVSDLVRASGEISERGPEWGRFQAFLQELHQQMELCRAEKRAELLLLELKWLCALRLGGDRRWGMKRFLRRKTPLATLVFSNLGVLFRNSRLPKTKDGRLCVGDWILDEIRLASPRTVDPALTVALGTYAGKMTLGINHDSKRLTDESARHFERLLAEEIRNALNGRRAVRE